MLCIYQPYTPNVSVLYDFMVSLLDVRGMMRGFVHGWVMEILPLDKKLNPCAVLHP